MIDFPILSLITFLPIIGALLILTVKGEEKYVNSNAKCVAIFTSLLTLVLSIYMYMQFDKTSAELQFVDANKIYKFGIDGISLFFVMLTAMLTPLGVMAGWYSIKKRVREHMIAFLAIETVVLTVLMSAKILPYIACIPSSVIFVLSVMVILGASFAALATNNIKKLIVYSFIANMGFVTIGIFTFNIQGLEGAMMQLLSHIVIFVGLFLCAKVLYDRLKSSKIKSYGSVVQSMPIFATVFMIFILASIGVPATNGFVGEFLVLLGVYQVSTYTAVFATIGIILSVTYMLRLYKHVMLGDGVHKEFLKLKDLNVHEMLMFVPLIVLVFWMGIYPSSFIDPMEPSLQKVIEQYND